MFHYIFPSPNPCLPVDLRVLKIIVNESILQYNDLHKHDYVMCESDLIEVFYVCFIFPSPNLCLPVDLRMSKTIGHESMLQFNDCLM